MFVAAFAGNHQAEIVSVQAVKEAVHRHCISRRIVFEYVLVCRRAHPRSQTFGGKPPRIGRARQRPPGAGNHQFINLFWAQTQGNSVQKQLMLSRFTPGIVANLVKSRVV
jgi:hypothetical protein